SVWPGRSAVDLREKTEERTARGWTHKDRDFERQRCERDGAGHRARQGQEVPQAAAFGGRPRRHRAPARGAADRPPRSREPARGRPEAEARATPDDEEPGEGMVARREEAEPQAPQLPARGRGRGWSGCRGGAAATQ